MVTFIIIVVVASILNALFGNKTNVTKRETLNESTQRFTPPQTTPLAPTPKYKLVQQDNYQTRLKLWHENVANEINNSKWISKSRAYLIARNNPVPTGTIGKAKITIGDNSLYEKLYKDVANHNTSFIEIQKKRLQSFFASVEKNPLTDEQIHACICMDDNVQIVAAAGSGKTSTMVAKAGYILNEGLATGDEILLLAFNTDAAYELAERCQERLSGLKGAEKVTAKTFHSFGLDVIAKATGKKPRTAPWLDQPDGDIKMTISIIDEICKKDSQFANDWHLFRTVYGRDIGKWNVKQQYEDYGNGRRGFRTANGEIVKSKEERMIANWLFYHHVPYQYERPYEQDTATESYSHYHPDFYYQDIQLYHEHFALDAEGNPPDHFGPKYKQGVIWKRQLHKQMNTMLFETTSHTIATGEALNDLRTILTMKGQVLRFDPDRVAIGAPPIEARQIAKLFRVFQQHVKSNGLSHAQIRTALTIQSKDGNADRLSRFVNLYVRVANEWENKLRANGWIDFENMLIQAAEHVENGRYQSPFTVILSDEFQDSSRARIRLLKALCNNKEPPAHLSVVGDDWQGINRFAGADIQVMTEFEKIFQDATRLTLNTTFRCPQHICDVSSAFIQANPIQIRKKVKTTNNYEAKKYLLAYGFNEPSDADNYLADQIALMHRLFTAGKLTPNSKGRLSVLLLGRYRKDLPTKLGQWQRRYSDHLDIDFKTVHRSKGLEADYVMLLNVVEGSKGFPSQIEDDPVLQIPMPAPDPFPMAEERRLFYVALTRARRQVHIYTMQTKPSRFLVELVKSKAVEIEAINAEPLESCPKCENGVLTIRSSQFGKFKSCSTFPRCDYKKNLPKETIARETITSTTYLPTPSYNFTMTPDWNQNESPIKFPSWEPDRTLYTTTNADVGDVTQNEPLIETNVQEDADINEHITRIDNIPQFKTPFFVSSSKTIEEDYRNGVLSLQRGEFGLASLLFIKAAEAGHISACFNLSLLLGSGNITPYNFDLAAAYWYKAADAGHPSAATSIPLLEAADNGTLGTDNLPIMAQQPNSAGPCRR